jgi:hypothetical protein
MGYVENVTSLAQEKDGVNLVMLKDLRMTLKIGPAEIKKLMKLYSNHNLMLYIIEIFLNGCLLKNFKILLILQKVVLVRFIQWNGLKEILYIGILKTKNGIDIIMINMY